MGKPPRKAGAGATFTKAAAKRIQRAVLEVERGGRDMARPHLRTAGSDVEIQRGTFTAPWAKGATATVTDAVLSSVTYTAKNYMVELTGTGTKPCLIAYAGGEWVLISAEVELVEQDVITGVTLGSSGLVFTKETVYIVGKKSPSPASVTISTTACT